MKQAKPRARSLAILSPRVYAWTKALIFVLCLGPLARLVIGAPLDLLGVNPVETIRRSTGTWTLAFVLATLSVIVKLDKPLFTVADQGFSGKALILLAGGLFLIYKATKEIHHKLEAEEEAITVGKVAVTFSAVIFQIVLLDMVFSIDSVITAVGMTDYVSIMVAANVLALIVMLALGKSISEFVERHPSVKVLALSFLLMIGLVLVAEGFGAHIPKGYIYGAMGFSVFVELINIRSTRKAHPVALHQVPHVADIPADGAN